jgi:hypothetical protein
MAAQPDAPYLLVQTVLIQDLSLAEAQRRITDLERQLAEKSPAPSAPTSFLGRPVQQRGPWKSPAPTTPVWTQSAAPAQAPPMMPPPMMAPPMMSPWGAPGASSGFLQQAVATAAGVAGGALLFQGIQSMFGPHYGGMLGGMPMQPGINETVINNNYYDNSDTHVDQGGGTVSDPGYPNDSSFDNDTGSIQSSDDFPSDTDFGGGDSGSFDV